MQIYLRGPGNAARTDWIPYAWRTRTNAGSAGTSWRPTSGRWPCGAQIREMLQQAPQEAQESLDQALEAILDEMNRR